MNKYKFIRSRFAYVGSWIYFILLTGVCIGSLIIGYKNTGLWDISGFLIMLCVFELPMIYLFPVGCHSINMDKDKIINSWWFINFRTILWSDVVQTGVGNVRAGYGTYKKFIYISKRPVCYGRW